MAGPAGGSRFILSRSTASESWGFSVSPVGVVLDVKPNSPAAKAGLHIGLWITNVNDFPTISDGDLVTHRLRTSLSTRAEIRALLDPVHDYYYCHLPRMDKKWGLKFTATGNIAEWINPHVDVSTWPKDAVIYVIDGKIVDASPTKAAQVLKTSTEPNATLIFRRKKDHAELIDPDTVAPPTTVKRSVKLFRSLSHGGFDLFVDLKGIIARVNKIETRDSGLRVGWYVLSVDGIPIDYEDPAHTPPEQIQQLVEKNDSPVLSLVIESPPFPVTTMEFRRDSSGILPLTVDPSTGEIVTPKVFRKQLVFRVGESEVKPKNASIELEKKVSSPTVTVSFSPGRKVSGRISTFYKPSLPQPNIAAAQERDAEGSRRTLLKAAGGEAEFTAQSSAWWTREIEQHIPALCGPCLPAHFRALYSICMVESEEKNMKKFFTNVLINPQLLDEHRLKQDTNLGILAVIPQLDTTSSPDLVDGTILTSLETANFLIENSSGSSSSSVPMFLADTANGASLIGWVPKYVTPLENEQLAVIECKSSCLGIPLDQTSTTINRTSAIDTKTLAVNCTTMPMTSTLLQTVEQYIQKTAAVAYNTTTELWSMKLSNQQRVLPLFGADKFLGFSTNAKFRPFNTQMVMGLNLRRIALRK